MRIDPETFEEWTAHPITEALMRMCEVAEVQARNAWMSATVDGGNCDPFMLKEIRTRIAVLREIRSVTAQDIEDIINGSN